MLWPAFTSGLLASRESCHWIYSNDLRRGEIHVLKRKHYYSRVFDKNYKGTTVYGKPATVNWTKIALHLTMNAVLFQFIEPKKTAWQTRRNNMQMEKEKVGEPGIFSKLWKWGSMSAFLDYYLFLPYPPQLSLNRGREGINWVNRLKNSFV